MISCRCSSGDYDILAVGKMREVTARTQRDCDSCNGSINPGDWLFVFDCWALFISLDAAGYCFSFADPIKEQWDQYRQGLTENLKVD